MTIKGFPPVGTRPTEKTSDSEKSGSTAADTKKVQIAPKDVFDQAKSSTIDQLLSKPKVQDLLNQKAQQVFTLQKSQLESMGVCAQGRPVQIAGKKLEPKSSCEPMTVSSIPTKKLEPAAGCISFRDEVAGNRLEPVGDCDPVIRNKVVQEKREPVGDCDPAIRLELAGSCIPMKKLEPAGNCITFRVEASASKLEPLASCEPGTRTLDKLKQQQILPLEKRLTKPEK